MTREADRILFGRLMREARPYWLHIAGILTLGLLATPLTLLAPLPLKIVVDSVIGRRPLPGFLARLPDTVASPHTRETALVIAIVLLFLVAILVQLRGLAHTLLDSYTGEKLVASFRARLFECVQRLSLTYHDHKGSAYSLYRIQYDAPCVQWIAVQGVIPLITSTFTLIGMIYVTARLDSTLALVAIAVAPVLFLTNQMFRRRLRSRWSMIKNVESSTMAVIQEALSTLRVVKAFGQEGREKDRFLAETGEGVRRRMAVARVRGVFDLVVGLIVAAGTAAALFIGVRHVQADVLSLGNLLLIMAYLSQLYGPLQAISKKLADLQQSFASAERAFSLLDEAPEVEEREGAAPLDRARGAVGFRDVDFRYNGGPPVLADVTFEVPSGTRVGISGPTGAGKTTLVSLLTRFYDPTGGAILLDGKDLRDYRLKDLRKQFAIVLQEPVLFSTTVAENIAYGRPGASQEDIANAARLANAHEFIQALPNSYETRVGERGMTLSGGERQRVALARAFLRDAPILILDEPTSSVDMNTEEAIVEATEHLMRGKTTFIIAHRNTTLRHCTVQLEIDDGRLVERREGVGGR